MPLEATFIVSLINSPKYKLRAVTVRFDPGFLPVLVKGWIVVLAIQVQTKHRILQDAFQVIDWGREVVGGNELEAQAENALFIGTLLDVRNRLNLRENLVLYPQ